MACPDRHTMTRHRQRRGYSVIELMIVMAVGGTLSAVALPQYLTTLDDMRASGAARHLSGRFQRARMEAVMRSAMVGVQFTQTASGYTYAVFVDGNRNGILTRDIQRGVDLPITPAERLPNQFTGVEFGAIPGLPPVDAGGTAPGADPIRLGSGSIASFSAAGSSSSGTVYIRSRRNAQYAVRIFGETGRTRMLKFEPRTRLWTQL
jgi:prepilin-type N-terminal cleavage/methylation domain-containing protein